jgi:hypothetical protein
MVDEMHKTIIAHFGSWRMMFLAEVSNRLTQAAETKKAALMGRPLSAAVC